MILCLAGFYIHKGLLNQSINQSMSDKGDCRTAPATPGLLKRFLFRFGLGNWCTVVTSVTVISNLSNV